MLTNQKQYIVNLANLNGARSELVGEIAVLDRSLLDADIAIPLGFVVTSTAFDDFLVGNDLVDFIGPKINDVDYNDEAAVKKVANEVAKAIKDAVIPDLIMAPLSKAYTGLSGFNSASVNLLVSSVNTDLDYSVKGNGASRMQVSGFEQIVAMLKELWAEFFSFKALIYRNQIGYEGFLTEAVVVQKQVQADVSGRIYSINPTDNNPDVYEAQAIWGMEDNKIWDEMIPDSYLIDAKNGDLLESKIVAQEWMLVRKGRQDEGGDPFIKVKISPAWQKHAKLDDRHLQQLYIYTKKIAELSLKPSELFFALEGGRIYITNIKHLKAVSDINTQFPLAKDLTKSLDDWGSKIEIIPAQDSEVSETTNVDYNPKVEQAFQKDLDDYVDEIQAEIDHPSVLEAASTDVIPRKFAMNLDAAASSQPETSIPNVVPPAIVAKAAQEDEDKVMVDLQPVSKLPSVLKGKGGGSFKLRFGLVHFVLAPFDLEDLTGDEILIMHQLEASNLETVNKVRGVLLETHPTELLLQALKVPVIFEVARVFEILHDKEVITLDPESGKVYIGAGTPDHKLDNITEDAAPEAEVAASPLVVEVKQPIIEAVAVKVEEVPAASQVIAEMNEELSHTPALQDFGIKIYENPANAPLNTTSDFWQTLDTDLQVDAMNTTGILLTADQIYDKFSVDPKAVFSDKVAFRHFLMETVNFIKELVLKSNGKSIIYQSVSQNFLQSRNLVEHVDDLVLVDLEVISWIRNRESIRNIWYAFADVLTAEQLADLKKNITSEGIRRSATFKVFAKISQSYAGIAVRSLVENGNIDGVIIDLDALLPAMGCNFKELDDNVTNFLSFVIDTVNSNNCQVYLLNRSITIDNIQIKKFIEKGLANFIVPVNKLMEVKLQVGDQELARLIKQKKRGRKKKKIDFGF